MTYGGEPSTMPGGDATLAEPFTGGDYAELAGGLMLGGRGDAPRTFRVVSFNGKAVGKDYDAKYYSGAKPDSAARKAARKFFAAGDAKASGKDSGVMSVEVMIKETTRGASTYANGQEKTFSYRVTRSRAAKKDLGVKDAKGKVIQRVWDYKVKSLR